MSEMIIVQCDYKDGECLARFEGFEPSATDKAKRDYLRKEGWSVQDGKHYCPFHTDYMMIDKHKYDYLEDEGIDNG